MDRLPRAGYTDGQIGEVVANVALTLFTSDFNHVLRRVDSDPAARSVASLYGSG